MIKRPQARAHTVSRRTNFTSLFLYKSVLATIYYANELRSKKIGYVINNFAIGVPQEKSICDVMTDLLVQHQIYQTTLFMLFLQNYS